MLVDLNKRIQLLWHPFFNDKPVRNGKQILGSCLEVMAREEDFLVFALGAVYNDCVSLLEDVQAVLEVHIVLWVFTEFGLLGLGVLRVELKVILLDIFLGGWRDWELPLISLCLDQLVAVATFAHQAVDCLKIEVSGRALSDERLLFF